jgi:RNA polymerase subunit RPABC4/transcription elongation factor Spt4
MPRSDYKRCKGCDRTTDECGSLSHNRLCAECGVDRLTENVVGISTHTGPAFTRWRRALAASVGGVLVDDALAAMHTTDADA